MNPRNRLRILAGATATAAVLGVAGCATTDGASESMPSTSGTTVSQTTVAQTTVPQTAVSQSAAAAVGQDQLDVALADQLRYLVEEEKLAHDVYVTLGEQWGSRIFTNIANSEVNHQQQVAGLLVAYGIEDPRIDQVGRFADPDLQALYDRLVAEGSGSQEAAMQVGVTIEEKDIADLTAAMPGSPPDVVAVLESLLSGSRNHLAAFQRQLA